jgi:hypothetical protein
MSRLWRVLERADSGSRRTKYRQVFAARICDRIPDRNASDMHHLHQVAANSYEQFALQTRRGSHQTRPKPDKPDTLSHHAPITGSDRSWLARLWRDWRGCGERRVSKTSVCLHRHDQQPGPLEEWGKLLGDVPTAGAILDRFLHHAQTITFTGRSYRLNDHATVAGKEDKNKKAKSKPNEPSTAEPAS